MKRLLILTLAALFCSCGRPDLPDSLKYSGLKYTPPALAPCRHTLDNGVTVFVIEDKKLPLFDILALFRTGGLQEPAEKEELAAMTADLLEDGGTKSIPADSLDELLDFLAASLSSSADLTSASVSLSVLNDKIDTALALFTEVVTRPAFEQKKLDLLKTRAREQVLHRFDHPKGVLAVLYNFVMYGPGKLSALPTANGLGSISRADVEAFHKRHYRPENMIVAVSGRFDTREMLGKLNATLGKWKGPGQAADTIPRPAMKFSAGRFFVEKEINQAYIRMGLPAVKRPHPDYYPLTLMNYIFGGAPFTSRISKKIREKEGLAYSAGSGLSCGYFYTGHFNVYLETKSASAAYAIDLALKEMREYVEKGATAEELLDAKKSLIDAFPANFKTGSDVASAFAMNQYFGRPDDHFDVYRDTINAISLSDISRVVRKYLKAESLAVCVVGKWEACVKGDGVHPVTLDSLGAFRRWTEKEIEKECLEP